MLFFDLLVLCYTLLRVLSVFIPANTKLVIIRILSTILNIKHFVCFVSKFREQDSFNLNLKYI